VILLNLGEHKSYFTDWVKVNSLNGIDTPISSRYFNLLKLVVTRYSLNSNFGEYIPAHEIITRTGFEFKIKYYLLKLVNAMLVRKNLCLAAYISPSTVIGDREFGLSFPSEAETMVGLKRLENVIDLVNSTLERKISGDIVETGVWRGGVVILIQGMLIANNMDKIKKVYVCDSFEGLPKQEHPIDKLASMDNSHYLKVSLETVRNNFVKYDLLRENVIFVKGWFRDTLPKMEVEQISILRIDADFYDSTMEVLKNLYHKVTPGGYVIVDDYSIDGCRNAIDDFREINHINTPIQIIDWTGIFWQKT
jgi:O-methyltransferase